MLERKAPNLSLRWARVGITTPLWSKGPALPTTHDHNLVEQVMGHSEDGGDVAVRNHKVHDV